MASEKTATEKLIRKTFGVSSFDEVLKMLKSKPDEFFQNTFFTEKSTFILKICDLEKEISKDGDLYSEAMIASRSGSIIESFASAALGEIKVEYEKNRKLLVNYLSFFYKKK